MNSVGDQVQHYANMWRNLTLPVRPSEGVLRVYREAMGKLPEKRVIVLGSTPELIDMAVDAGAERIVSIERSPTVVQAFRELGRNDWSKVQFIVGDWLEDRSEFHSRFNCIMCDGGILFLQYPGQWSRLFEVVHSYLEPGGIFAAKGWAEPPGDRDYKGMVEEYIGGFKESSSRRNAEEKRTAFIWLASVLRLIAFVGAVRPDGSYDQELLVERLDDLIGRLEGEFPDPGSIGITHAALKHLARSRPNDTDTVAGAGYDRAEPLLKRAGLVPRNFPLSDPPIDGSTYVFVAQRV